MSNLAMSAGLIEEEDSNASLIHNKKKQLHKTQRFRSQAPDIDFQKVNSVLQSIHNAPVEEESSLGQFTPLSKGSSTTKEGFSQPGTVRAQQTGSKEPLNYSEGDFDLHNLQNNFMNESQVKQYYKKYVPNYFGGDSNVIPKDIPYKQASFDNSGASTAGADVLMDKLNYVIHLLEEQQDQKTDTVTEEVVLYSFLGIFVIFVVDSFAKVGKYTR